MTAYGPPSAAMRRLLDVAVAAWTIVLIVLAILLAFEVRHTRALADSAANTAAAADQTAALVTPLEALPLVGGSVATIRNSIHDAAEQAAAGRASLDRTAAISLSTLLIVALAPLAVYAPQRLRWRSELAWLRDAQAAGELPRPLLEQLARNTAQRAGYAELLDGAASPWDEIAAGRFERLATIELSRLGITTPAS